MEGHDRTLGVEDWDKRYGERQALWSGAPNSSLVAEVEALAPGRALDVGCGEGADAIWLSERGWTVTAIDVSRIALDRAATAANQRGVEVTWLRSGLVEADLPARSFDLVSAQYFALLRSQGSVAEHVLLDAVAPGGTLLAVHHADFGAHQSPEHGFDPEAYVHLEDIRALLGPDWTIEVFEERERHLSAGAGAGHTRDRILRARRNG